MARNVSWVILLVSIILFSSCAKAISPTYNRKNLTSAIEKNCRQEYALKVIAKLNKNTIFVYLPLQGKLSPQILKDKAQLKRYEETIRKIFLVVRRAMLSMDTPPQFYAIVAVDTKSGAMLDYIGFVGDVIKSELNLISVYEYAKRIFIGAEINKNIIGKNPEGIAQTFNLDLGNFVTLLIRQRLYKEFTAEGIKQYYKVNKIKTYYYKGKLLVEFDIQRTGYGGKLLFPFQEAKKIILNLLKTYKLDKLYEVKIYDIANDRMKTFSISALQEESRN